MDESIPVRHLVLGVPALAPFAGRVGGNVTAAAPDTLSFPEWVNDAKRQPLPDPQESRPRSMRGVLGDAESWVRVFRYLDRIVEARCPVLLSGPHGSGKHTCARALHRAAGYDGGSEGDAPFVLVDGLCSEEAEDTSRPRSRNRTYRCSVQSRPESWAALAAGGTLFVDDLTALPASAQIFLEEQVRNTRGAPFRLVIGTKHAPEALLLQRCVRPSFYYRVSVMCLDLPPLRDRGGDVVQLARAFLEEVSRRPGGPRHFSGPAENLLLSYPWPGNMSELRSAVEHAAAVATGAVIGPLDLPAHVRSLGQAPQQAVLLPEAGIDLRQTLESFENELLLQALDRTGWNKQRAARLLGLNRTTLVEMLKRKRLHRVDAIR